MKNSTCLDCPLDQFVRNTMILNVSKTHSGIRVAKVTTQLIVGYAVGDNEPANIDKWYCFRMVRHFNLLVPNPGA